MNIQVQLCGLFMLALLFIFYKSTKTLHLYKEKIFYRAMCIILVSLCLDILSLAGIWYRGHLPGLFVNLLCKIYLISLIWGALAALIYASADLFSRKKHQKLAHYLHGLAILQSLITLFLPLHICAAPEGTYTYGLSVNCVYFFVFVYILATLFSAIGFAKKVNPRRAFAVILWMAIWITFAAIQFFNKNLLIVGYASAIGILILFVVMENPEGNLDRWLGFFNSYALTTYLKELLDCNTVFHILELSFRDMNTSEENGHEFHKQKRTILRLLSSYKNIFVFQNTQTSLVLICLDKDCLKEAGTKLSDFFSDNEIFHEPIQFTFVEQANTFTTIHDIFHFLAFIRTLPAYKSGNFFAADKESIQKYKEQRIVEQEITHALADDRVEVFFQPIYSNQDNRFTSAEALVRIRKRDDSLLSPGVFIPIAEKSGKILELGERVMEKVCHFLKNSDAVKLGIHYIEVNLSVIQCEKKDLAKRLIALVERYDIDPRLINLEITETASISARATLLENMKTLIQYGFSFSLDDFGKGESNLMYIVEMPVSLVKLDYDMSKAFFQSQKAKNVVQAVVAMAHDMNLKLVAEGIETKEEIQGMLQENIDYIQGYYYSRPIPESEFLEFLREHSSVER